MIPAFHIYNSYTPVFSQSRPVISPSLIDTETMLVPSRPSARSHRSHQQVRQHHHIAPHQDIEPQPLHLHRHDYYPTRQTTPGCAQLTSTTSWTNRGPRFFFLLFTDTELNVFNELKLGWMVISNRKCRDDYAAGASLPPAAGQAEEMCPTSPQL